MNNKVVNGTQSDKGYVGVFFILQRKIDGIMPRHFEYFQFVAQRNVSNLLYKEIAIFVKYFFSRESEQNTGYAPKIKRYHLKVPSTIPTLVQILLFKDTQKKDLNILENVSIGKCRSWTRLRW